MKKVYLLILLCFSGTCIISQNGNTPGDTANYPYWINMMQDYTINYYTTVHAFEKYYENRVVEPHTGFKTFKRWEEFWRTRVDAQGNFPAPDALWNAYYNYFGTGSSSTIFSTGGAWQPLGPTLLPSNSTGQPNGNGRINAIAFHPTDANKIFVGTPQGGLWSTTDGGATWTSNTDNLPSLGVSAILIDPTNTSVMYIGVGDRDGGDSYGMGVMKTTNGGSSWSLVNNTMGNVTVGMMVMNPLNNNIILAATSGGIYKTVNGGTTWSRKSPNTNNYKDIKYHPTDTNIVYVVENSVFYRSTDAGNSFTAITAVGSSGLPAGTRAVIGISRAAPDLVYVVLANTTYKGTYLSHDKGQTFVTKSTTPNIFDYSNNGSGTASQAWYDMGTAVDTANAGIIYVGGVNIFKSTDSGSTWTCVAHWTGNGAPAIHADQHQLKFNTINGRLYAGNDGGLYYTSNGGSSWTNITTGLNISQMYRIGQSAQSPSNVIVGWQDNGTGYYRASILGNNKWKTTRGGDGMECIIDPNDSNIMYGALYYGDISRTLSGGGLNTGVAANNTFTIDESGAWITPYVLHNANSNKMFVGYKNLWRGINVKSTPTWAKLTAYSGTSNINFIEHCAGDTSRLYFARENNSFFRTDDLYNTTPVFTNISSSTPSPSNNVVWVETNPKKPNQVFIIQNGTIQRSLDKGATWTNITGTLPSVTKNCLLIDKMGTDALYVGTDVGVFYRDSTMTAWVAFKTGLPANSRITEMEMFYDYANTSDCRLSAGTYGRGLWQSDVYLTTSAPQANFVSDTLACTNRTITLQDMSTGSPDSWQWTITPSTFNFVNGTNANSQNPQVQFTAVGSYTIKLFSKRDGWGYSTTTKSNYVVVGGTPPSVSVSASSNTICKGSPVTLTAIGATNFTWYGNNIVVGNVGIITVNPTVTTRYVAYGSNGNCLDSAALTVTVNSVTGISLTNAVSICSASSTSLTASGALSYSWSPANGLSSTTGSTVTASPATTTRYTVTFTAANTCTDTMSVLVTVLNKPSLSFSGNTTICSGSSTSVTATGANSFAWFNGSTLIGSNAAISLNPISNTTYKLVGSNSNGCKDSMNVTITVVSKPTVSFTGNTTICAGGTTTLTATGASNFSWYNGTTLIGSNAAINLNPSATTTYKLVGTIGSATCSDSTTITITVNNLPNISINPTNPKIALGQLLPLTATGASTYTWSPSAGLSATTGSTVVASPSVTTLYTVTGKDANNCENTKTVTVTIAPAGINASAAKPKVLIQPNPAQKEISVLVYAEGTLQLYDLTGKNVYSAKLTPGSNTLNLEHLPKGIYTAEFLLGEDKIYQKLVMR